MKCAPATTFSSTRFRRRSDRAGQKTSRCRCSRRSSARTPDRNESIIDAGALAFSKDLGPDHVDPQFGYGVVCDAELRPLAAKLISLSQEHGKLSAALPVGTRVRVVPNHSCLTAAMYDRYHVLENGAVVDEWRPVRGW